MNFDEDTDDLYPSNLYLLHPVNRTQKCQEVDVIFVHGLLGGVFFTWRQRKKKQPASGFMGMKSKNGKCLSVIP